MYFIVRFIIVIIGVVCCRVYLCVCIIDYCGCVMGCCFVWSVVVLFFESIIADCVVVYVHCYRCCVCRCAVGVCFVVCLTVCVILFALRMLLELVCLVVHVC